MNAITERLRDEWPRLRPGRPEPERLRCFLKTPRFRASGHVLYFVFADDEPVPGFVVKVSRVPGDDRWLDREAANLGRVQAARPGGFDSIPRAVGPGERDGLRMLVQTVVPGETMDRETVRRRPGPCTDAVTAWLSDLHATTAVAAAPGGLRDLVDAPLDRLEALCDGRPGECDLVRKTRGIVAGLGRAEIPLVFEHGDLSAPNILLDADGRVGVVDWELADPAGLPAVDLFFFLTFVAFARSRADDRRAWLSAFRAAFFGPGAWAAPWIRRYAHALRLPPDTLEPLFVSTWVRYVAVAAARLGAVGTPRDDGRDVVDWLTGNRFRLLWEYAVEHRGELNL